MQISSLSKRFGVKVCTVALLIVALFSAVVSSNAAVAVSKKAAVVSTGPIIKLITTKGPILIKLYPKDAPLSCGLFLSLVKSKYYDGLMFHRVADLGGPGEAHIVQIGDPASRNPNVDPSTLGQGGSGKAIKGEFSSNGVKNPLLHNTGAVAMARTSEPDSADGQIYICTTPAHDLDGNYAVFGYVIKGIENASKIVVGDRITKAIVIRAK